MRRRRHQLQVSTFPFLAVLLCAMGSLILLLLVIDRRAKEAAREKALLAYRQHNAAQELQEAARRAELERQSQELHARLRHANENLVAQVHATVDDVQAAQRRLDEARRRYVETQSRMKQTTEHLMQDRARLGQGETEARRAAQAAASNQKALARLETELRELEQTVIDLKLARQRQTQTYSLMPYRGRQGDNRRPLYIECTAGGYVFHPDRLRMRLAQASLADLRAEVQHRLNHLRGEAHGNAPKAYVLLLVRPDGIQSYYGLMRALDGLGLDFGYEFVERDWVLDFQNESVLGQQPWMAEAAPAAPARSDLKPPDVSHRSHASLGGVFTSASAVGGTRSTGGRALAGTSQATAESSGQVGVAGAPGRSREVPGSRQAKDSVGSRPFAMLGTPIGNPSEGEPGRGQARGVAAAPGNSPAALHWNASDGPGGQVVTSSAGTGGVDASDKVSPSDATPPVVGMGRRGTNSDSAIASSGSTAPGGAAGSAGADAHSPMTGSTTNQASGTAGSADPKGVAPAAPSVDPTPLSSDPATGPDLGDGANAAHGPTMLAKADPLAGIAPGQEKASPPTPVVRPALLRANRDWIIGLECRDTEIILHPGQKAFAVTALEDGSMGTALASTLRNLITHRQASVLPGQPPYRPLLRFLVWPNGLRGYYDAYPLLEGLRLPMGRVDVHSNDELRRALYPGA